jgi:glycosidase
VFYEIFVRAFADSNGNGIGDFNGITQKLDYLNDGDPATTSDLGIDGIWLMPIFPSPSYHGYDVTDYYNVNSQYGTMYDFKTLLNDAHKRGIKVVIVLIHVGVLHIKQISVEDLSILVSKPVSFM